MTDDTRPRLPITEDGGQRMFSAAANARTARNMLNAIGDPKLGARLWWDDCLYPWEKETAWLRQYLSAAIEHVEMYADIVVPRRYFEGMEVYIAPRPFFTLCRAAIESASQAVWVMYGETPAKRVERHVRLLYKDFDEHAKAAKARGDVTGEVAALRRRDAIVERVGSLIKIDLTRDRLNYLDMVKPSAKLVERRAEEFEVLWRTSSAAAHGKGWFVDATHETQLGEEYEPGYYRATKTPREDVLLEIEETACHFVLAAVFRYARVTGYDAGSLLVPAFERALRDTTPKPGSEQRREELFDSMRERMAAINARTAANTRSTRDVADR